MIVNAAKSVFSQVVADLHTLHRDSGSFNSGDEQVKLRGGAAFRLLGTTIAAAGAATALIGVISIPVSLSHPDLLLVSITLVALGALGLRIGLDLIQIVNNFGNDWEKFQTEGAEERFWSILRRKNNEVEANPIFSRYSDGTFFKPLWKSLMVIFIETLK